MIRRLRPNSGYTLPEVLMYGVILASVVNLCAALSLSARRVYALGEISMTRLDALRDIEADFRLAAARANTLTDRVDG